MCYVIINNMDYANRRLSIMMKYLVNYLTRSLCFLSVYYRLLHNHCKLIAAFSEVRRFDLKIEYCSPFSAFGSTLFGQSPTSVWCFKISSYIMTFFVTLPRRLCIYV